jgi:phosphoribosylglycinamide formyltransferase-1
LKKNKAKIAIMASGNGSNAQAIAHHARDTGEFEVVCALTDCPDAYVVFRMERLGIPCEVVPRIKDREEHDRQVVESLKKYDFQWLVMAGYMRILTSKFLKNFWDKKLERYRIINIHPSLLPDFPGIRAYEQAFESGKSESGVTVHFVDEGVDTGPIIAQQKFPRLETDSLEDFKKRGVAVEHQLYKKALEIVLREYS